MELILVAMDFMTKHCAKDADVVRLQGLTFWNRMERKSFNKH